MQIPKITLRFVMEAWWGRQWQIQHNRGAATEDVNIMCIYIQDVSPRQHSLPCWDRVSQKRLAFERVWCLYYCQIWSSNSPLLPSAWSWTFCRAKRTRGWGYECHDHQFRSSGLITGTPQYYVRCTEEWMVPTSDAWNHYLTKKL